MRPAGKKEVAEAVIIAALSALVTGIITWGFEVAKDKAKPKPKLDEKDDDDAPKS